MGKAGGQLSGKIDPNDFFNPTGLAIDSKGRLWVTEQTYQPKRVSVWNIPQDIAKEAPTVAEQFFGGTSYGGGAWMVDPSKPNIITGQYRDTWEINLTTGKYRPIEVLYHWGQPSPFFSGFSANDGWEIVGDPKQQKYYMLHGIDGDILCEKRNGRLVPVASYGTITGVFVLRKASGFTPLLADPFFDAVKKDPRWPDEAKRAGLDVNLENKFPIKDGKAVLPVWPPELNAYNWTDANGDGEIQSAEIKLSYLAPQGQGTTWTLDPHNDGICTDTAENLYRMKLQGYSPSGAPVYDWSKAEMLNPWHAGDVHNMQIGQDGSMLIERWPSAGRDDKLRLTGPDGKLRWSYPSLYTFAACWSIPGARDGKVLMQPGKLYGTHGLQGVVKGPGDLGEVLMIHGWHGMNYFFTRDDGLFIGTMFKPAYSNPSWDTIKEAKVGMLLDDYSLADECFWGSFARAEADAGGFQKDHFYLLGLGRSAIAELIGLETAQRLGGEIELPAASVQQVRAESKARAVQKFRDQEALATWNVFPAPPGDPAAGPGSIGRDRAGGFWSTTYDEKGLTLQTFTRARAGNHGALQQTVFFNDAPSWEQVYGGGESMEMLLSADPAADPNRMEPGAADQRLVLSLLGGKFILVRYRHLPADQARQLQKADPENARILGLGESGEKLWLADRIGAEVVAEVQDPGFYNRQFAKVGVTIPWKTLGMEFKPGMSFKGNLGTTWRRIGGGVDRQLWVGDTSASAYNPATAMEMHPALWATFVLRPEGYQPGQDVATVKPASRGKPLPVLPREAVDAEAARYGDTVTWVHRSNEALHLKWYVPRDSSPLLNKGNDWTSLFTTGDACDLQIESPTLGKCRYVISVYEDHPIVVRLRYDAKKGDDTGQAVIYRSPVREFRAPVVEKLELSPQIGRGTDWYTVELAIPWKMLGIEPKPGLRIPAELGVMRSDPTGTKTASRAYWNNDKAAVVSDVPTEAAPTDDWGALELK
ncbi:MAG TPA: hypothetical protein VIL86_01910 [Tepidisphaeraceae bacterium]|jgi:hypothetical protein